jgi:hypothetical protein
LVGTAGEVDHHDMNVARVLRAMATALSGHAGLANMRTPTRGHASRPLVAKSCCQSFILATSASTKNSLAYIHNVC